MEWDRQRRRELLFEFARSGILDAPSLLEGASLKAYQPRRFLEAAVEGDVTVGGRSLTLRVGISHNFPFHLPHVFLVRDASLPFLPHVGSDGWVCFTQREGLSLRFNTPLRLLE